MIGNEDDEIEMEDQDSDGDSNDDAQAQAVIDEKGLLEGDASEEDSDSSEDHEDINEVDEDAVLERLSVIDSKLLSEPYSYDLYVEKIGLYKSIGDLDELRKAREKLSELYPLSPALWLEWILDEQKLSATEEEKENIMKLFERATEDYLSVELWLECTKFHLSEVMGEDNGVEKCRNIFEKALASCGLHVSFGSLIWDAYRDFEAALLGVTTTDDEMTAQETRYLNICRRQLSVPLLEMEKSYEQITSKIALNEAATAGYKAALKTYQKILPWETKLLRSTVDTDKIVIYRDYIEAEKSSKSSPSRILCLYERAVADHPLDGSLWSEYLDYVAHHLKVDETILNVSRRATRNCPWILDLWIKYMKNVEQITEGNEKVKEVFENSLLYCSTGEQAGTMWLKYLESLRRRLDPNTSDEKLIQVFRNTFEAAETHLLQLLEEPNDYICQILMFHARFEAHHAKSMEKSRQLWDDIFKRGYGDQFRVWNQYIMLERQYGDANVLRGKLGKAIGYVKDDIPSIADIWLNLERDFGSLKSMGACEIKIAKQMEKYYKTIASSTRDTTDNDSWPTTSTEKNWKSWKKDNQPSGGNKRKFDKSSPTKRPANNKILNDDSTKVKRAKTSEDVVDRKLEKREHEFKQPQPVASNKLTKKPPMKTTQESQFHGEIVKHDPSLDNFTVFLSNLAFSSGEDEIRAFFKDTGVIRDVRIVRDFKGQSKGFAYVCFDTIEAAQSAISKDREPLGGRPVFISKCEPDRSMRRVQFKYSTNLEKNKLFVKNLPDSVTTDALKIMFGQYGKVTDARVVMYRNGFSKGIAFVDFEKEADAAMALLKTDGMELQDKVLSVAISNPPPKQQKQVVNEFLTPGQTARRKIGTFVPRSVQVAASSSKGGANATSTNSDAAATASGPKTNQQFRELFQMKK